MSNPSTLPRRSLGDTGLSVSALGFGASPLGGMFGRADEDEGVLAVRLALDEGIDFFDVAPYYGRAEQVLGRALAGVPRSRYAIATKVGRYGDSDFDFSAERIVAGLERSLRRLGVDHVDLLQCHDLEYGPIGRVVGEALPALDQLRRQGKCRFIGITGYPLAMFPMVLERSPVPIHAVLSYCHWCLHDTSLARLLPYFARRKLGVINAAPLGMGLFSTDGPRPRHPAPIELKNAAASVVAHCSARGVDIADLAIAFACQEPRIATTLVGMATRDQVRRSIAAAALPLDAVLLEEVRSMLAPVQDRPWPSGRDEYAVDLGTAIASSGAGAEAPARP